MDRQISSARGGAFRKIKIISYGLLRYWLRVLRTFVTENTEITDITEFLKQNITENYGPKCSPPPAYRY
jgi:hypothetical protein